MSAREIARIATQHSPRRRPGRSAIALDRPRWRWQNHREVTMALREAVALELRVALSRNAQPIWFRALKWAVIVSAAVYFWGAPRFWWWVAGLLAASLGLHALWRTKTKRWTRPWGGWNDLAAARRAAKE
jgi:hypothetical protein